MKLRTRIIVGVSSFIAMTISGVIMYQQQLWGFETLFFLLGLWIGCIMLFFPYMFQGEDGCRRFSLSTLSGLLLAMSFPPFVAIPVIWIAFTPLFYSFYTRSKRLGEKAIKPFLWDAFHAFVIWNICSTFWVANSALGPAFFAIWVNAFLMTLPMLITAISYHRLSERVKWAGLLAPWICFEYIHLNWDLSWPWLTVGNAFASTTWAVQWYEFTGVLGGTFWVLLINHLLAQNMTRYGVNKAAFKQLIPILFIVFTPILISLVIRYGFPIQNSHREPTNVALIQPNYEPHFAKNEIPESTIIERILSQLNTTVAQGVSTIILPETMFTNVNINEPFQLESMRQLLHWCEEHPGVSVITGLGAYQFIDTLTPYARDYRGHKLYERMNVAAELDESGMIDVYLKAKFVPGAEKFAYKEVLFFLDFIVEELGGSTAGYRPSKERKTLGSNGLKVGPLICYESVYGEFCNGYIHHGADILAVMTEDGWWGDTPGYTQHFDYARLRAIEQRREVVQASSTGISGSIDAYGNIKQSSTYGEQAVIIDQVQPYDVRTFYNEWGDIIGRLGLFVTIVVLMQLLVSVFKRSMLV